MTAPRLLLRTLVLAVALVAGCTPGRRIAARPLMPDPVNMVPLRARTVYRDMGLMVDTSRLPFVASVRYLAGATPDSTLLVFAMSLANRALNFRRDSADLVADYHVELTLRRDSTLVRQVVRDEKVRVGTVPETMRRDESIIFQQYVTVHPGIYSVNVVVRDRTSPAYAQFQLLDTVPQLDAPGLGWPIPIYEGTGRVRRGAVPELVANPRGTTSYGEWARFYVEGYGLARGTRLAARVVDLDSVELWRDTMTLGEGSLASVQFVIKPGGLPLGRAEFQVQAVGSGARASAPFLVTFSDIWAVNRFDQTVDLLRYFARQDLVAKLKAAPRGERAAAWREFYRASDPTPATPQNEPLDKYFHRIDVANLRYSEPKTPGWKTDRGEVYITLGEPDQAFEVPGKVAPGLRWEYASYHTTLAFQDNEGLGQYHLTTESRADYERALAEARAAK
jgi:GWxTD domain-containing protein